MTLASLLANADFYKDSSYSFFQPPKRMAWIVSKQGVCRPSGQGCPAKHEAWQSEAETRAKFAAPGQTSVPARNKTSQTHLYSNLTIPEFQVYLIN